MGGALGRSPTDSHEKMTFLNDGCWKVYSKPKVGIAHCTELKTVYIFKIGCLGHKLCAWEVHYSHCSKLV
jgi:hypothetical protein